ncbi:TPA: single-stranded DNA-binding protein [Streptococcus suis]
MNNVQLLGRLTRDVDIRQTTGGVAVARFTVAVNRSFKNQQGEREADFISCVAFRQTAELIARYFHKGSQIAVDGRIQTGSYDNQQGQKVYTTDVVVNNFYFTESKAQNESRANFGGNDNGFQSYNNYQANTNFNQGSNGNSFNNDFNQQSSPFAGFDDGPIDITEDDLPF